MNIFVDFKFCFLCSKILYYMVHAFSIEMQNQIYDMKEVFINKMSFNIFFYLARQSLSFTNTSFSVNKCMMMALV